MPLHRLLFVVAFTAPVLFGSPGFGQDLQGEVRKGWKLASNQAAALEHQLGGNPEDLAVRAQLLGYYWRQRGTGRAKHTEHVLWFIENEPGSEVLAGPAASIFPMVDPDGYLKAKEAWLRRIEDEPRNAVFLKHAAGFFTLTEEELSVDLLKRAEVLEPSNPHWARELGQLRWMKARNPFEGSDREGASLASADFERAYELSDSADRAELMPDLAVTALVAGDIDKARGYAESMLKSVPSDLNKGRFIHFGNLVLGRIALTEGNLEEAGSRLLAAARTEGSPVLRSFGPDMALAKALLERGRRQEVLRYMESCLEFWDNGQDTLRDWIALIEAGRTPDFRRNLRF